MPGIFPEELAGGLVVRDEAGVALNPPGVERAYSPPAAFVSSCPITGLPSDCDARIEPRQINAIVSELVALAECFDSTGPWDCSSLKNLCNTFTAWALVNISGIYVGDTPPIDPEPNKLWWESDNGMLFLWYDDGTSQQWVQINGASVFADQESIVGAGAAHSPFQVGIVDCGSY